jgi:hypothetical protein
MAKAPVDVATPKLELVTCVKKWMSRIADGVDRVWIIFLLSVSTRFFSLSNCSFEFQNHLTYTISPSTCTSIKLPLRC